MPQAPPSFPHASVPCLPAPLLLPLLPLLLLLLQGHTKAVYRPAETAQALGFLANYARLRIDQAAAEAEAGEKAAADHAASGAAADEDSGLGESVAASPPPPPQRGSGGSSSAVVALAAIEVSYNAGRFFHQLGMLHLALGWYRRCLGVPAPPSAAATGTPQREAAHNLICLLRQSGGAEQHAAEMLRVATSFLAVP